LRHTNPAARVHAGSDVLRSRALVRPRGGAALTLASDSVFDELGYKDCATRAGRPSA